MGPRAEQEHGVARFEESVLPHMGAAYNLARWLTRNGHDAEDVVQEACERALKYFDAFRGGDAKAWFLTVVRHACYDWLKRNRPSEIAPGDSSEVIENASDPAMLTPEEAVLREFEELPYKDIARMVDIPIGTVMSRLARARALLQRSPLLHAIRDRSAGAER